MGLFLEVAAVLLLLLVFFRLTPLYAWLRALPWPHAAVLFGFLFFTFFGHFLLDAARTYPFTDWSMYSAREPGAAEWVELTGINREGREIPLHPTRLMPLMRNVRPQRQIRDRLEVRDPHSLAQAKALARAWARLHSQQQRYQLVEVAVRVARQPGPGQETEREEVLRTRVAP